MANEKKHFRDLREDELEVFAERLARDGYEADKIVSFVEWAESDNGIAPDRWGVGKPLEVEGGNIPNSLEFGKDLASVLDVTLDRILWHSKQSGEDISPIEYWIDPDTGDTHEAP